MADGIVSQATHYEQNAAPARPLAVRSSLGTALSYLFLLVVAIQGFHVIEHIVLVVQVEALGFGLAEAHGLLGARVDFEWLHFWYNSSFLAALVLLFAHRRRLRGVTPPKVAQGALLGGVALQAYHVVEHTIRMVQYYQTDCTPCLGLIGQVVPFIWPHLFFGVFSYAAFSIAYFGYGLHRELLPARRDATKHLEPAAGAVEPARAVATSTGALRPLAGNIVPARARASLFDVPTLEPPVLPAFMLKERWNYHG